MDINRILTEYDAYFARNDAHGAYVFITERINEAQKSGDWGSELTMVNEIIGYCRKKLMIDEGHEYIERAGYLVEAHGLANDVNAATTWLNCATALRAFGESDASINYFTKTEEIYRNKLQPFDYRYASLYNNMSLVYSDIGKYDVAEKLCLKAVEILITDPESAAELASTYVTLAVITSKKAKLEDENADITSLQEVKDYVGKAMNILNPEGDLPNQYYAYMCLVNAKSLEQLGFISESRKLNARGEEFYSKIKK